MPNNLSDGLKSVSELSSSCPGPYKGIVSDVRRQNLPTKTYFDTMKDPSYLWMCMNSTSLREKGKLTPRKKGVIAKQVFIPQLSNGQTACMCVMLPFMSRESRGAWPEGRWCCNTGSRDWLLHSKKMHSYWPVFASR